MKSSTPLRARNGLKKSKAGMRSSTLNKVSAKQAKRNRERSKVRAGRKLDYPGYCSRCGQAWPFEYVAGHHKTHRSAGGSDQPENIEEDICPRCHNGPDGHRTEMPKGFQAGRIGE